MSRRAFLFFSAGLALALVLGWAAFPRLLYARAEQPLRFSHQTHASKKTGFSCADCHPIAADGRFAGIPAIENCAGCHAEPQGPSADEKRLVEEYVKPGREIPWLVYGRQPENVRFPHAIHVSRAGIECERCHGPHGTTDSLRPHETNRISGYSRDIWGPSLARVGTRPWQRMKMSDCESCHAEHGRERTACLACHK
jgi:menaquinone reductase, multiheme cytochrome c subunit